MPEWAPGVLPALLRDIGNTGRVSQKTGLLKIAAAIEAKAKDDLGRTSHGHGTPSPAARGGPPSLVSGTLRRSIGHQSLAGDLEVRVGTQAGVYPPVLRSGARRARKGSGSRATPSSKYGLYQETIFDHPFLKPAFDAVVGAQAVAIWLSSFETWPRLL